MCRETLQLEDGAATLNDRSEHCHHCVWQRAGLMDWANGKGNVSPIHLWSTFHLRPHLTHDEYTGFRQCSITQGSHSFSSWHPVPLNPRVPHAEDCILVPFPLVFLSWVNPYFRYCHLLIVLNFMIGLFLPWSYSLLAAYVSPPTHTHYFSLCIGFAHSTKSALFVLHLPAPPNLLCVLPTFWLYKRFGSHVRLCPNCAPSAYLPPAWCLPTAAQFLLSLYYPAPKLPLIGPAPSSIQLVKPKLPWLGLHQSHFGSIPTPGCF